MEPRRIDFFGQKHSRGIKEGFIIPTACTMQKTRTKHGEQDIFSPDCASMEEFEKELALWEADLGKIRKKAKKFFSR